LGEALRQKCLIEILKETQPAHVALTYFNYLAALLGECEKEIKEMDKCAEKVYDKVKGLPA